MNLEEINKILEHIRWDGKHLIGLSPNFTSWKDKKNNLYKYSKEKVLFNGKIRYLGLFYRYKRYKLILRKVYASSKKKSVKSKLLKIHYEIAGELNT